MQRLLFESSPFFIFLCAGAGLGYAYLLYRSAHGWSKQFNRVLFGLRAVVVFLLALLLLGPVLKLITNQFEKPSLVFLLDTSTSVGEQLDSAKQVELTDQLRQATKTLEEQDYEVTWANLNGEEIINAQFDASTSDINKGIQQIINQYEGRNLAGLVLFSDGIYNSGASPAYSTVRIPVYTVGLGDTVARVDLALKNIAFNKVAYEGNKFPVRVQVLQRGFENRDLSISISKNGKVIATKQQEAGNRSLLDFDFQVDANGTGIQRFDILLSPLAGESNTRNNRASIFIEIVEGKKKIVLIAPAPHPDIKALQAVVEKNSNYEFVVHIPGVNETDAALLKPDAAELYIFHQVADMAGKTTPLFQSLYKSGSSLLLMIGGNTNLRQLPAYEIPIQFDGAAGQWDDVTPVVNNNFRDFGFAENTNGIFSRYPPTDVPFGKFTWPASANVILFQRIGSVTTDRPLLMVWPDENRKISVLIGEGIWRWRLNEFADTGNTLAFDELFSKLVQYLSTLEDKRKFKSFPLQNEFSEAEPVIIESQVYNELFELTYGNTIKLEVRNEKGEVSNYSYITSPGNGRYRIGGLKEGVYRFKASTMINNKTEDVNGQFLVQAQNLEVQNLTADFNLLRTVSNQSGGKFYKTDQLNQLVRDLSQIKAASHIHTEETFNQLINLKWVFFLLLTLISAEWFLRKYLGSY